MNPFFKDLLLSISFLVVMATASLLAVYIGRVVIENYGFLSAALVQAVTFCGVLGLWIVVASYVLEDE